MTHPHFGLISWAELRERLAALRLVRRCCSWCLSELGPRRRTRCGSPDCENALNMLISWEVTRKQVLRRQRRCSLCGGRGPFEVDHIVPVSLGGSGDLENLRALCHARCHRNETQRLKEQKAAFVAAVGWRKSRER